MVKIQAYFSSPPVGGELFPRHERIVITAATINQAAMVLVRKINLRPDASVEVRVLKG